MEQTEQDMRVWEPEQTTDGWSLVAYEGKVSRVFYAKWEHEYEAQEDADYLNALEAAARRLPEALAALPFTLKFITNGLNTDVTLCWKGDGDDVSDEALRVELRNWLTNLKENLQPASQEGGE